MNTTLVTNITIQSNQDPHKIAQLVQKELANTLARRLPWWKRLILRLTGFVVNMNIEVVSL